MKLEALASRPQLIKIEIADENIVKTYGETIEFWIYDRQDMDVYMSMASLSGTTNNLVEVARLVKDLIHNEAGEHILKDGQMLPMDIMVKVIEETLKRLGNSQTQTSPEMTQ